MTAAAAPTPPFSARIFGNVRRGEFLALFAFALALSGLGDLVRLVEWAGGVFPYVDTWKLHQFVFSYADLGFVKRGLFGWLIGLDPGATTDGWPVRALSSAMLLALTGLLLAFSFSLPRVPRLLLAASPAVFLQAGFDLGRIDQLIYALVLLILLSGWSWALLLAPAMVLLHEGAFLIHLPLLFAAHRLAHGPSRAAVVAMALSAAALAAVLLFGGLDPARDIRLLYPAMTEAAYAMLSAGLSGNFGFVAERAAWADGFFQFRLGFIAAYAGLIYVALRPMLPAERFLGLPLQLAILAPLLLALVGIDWPRWIAAAVLNMFILACVSEAMRAPAGGTRAPVSLASKIAIATAFAAALAGPMGDATPLPLLDLIRNAGF